MNILWTNSTMSGIGDRVIDLLLMSTYAKIKNANLYLVWKKLDSSYKHTWTKNEGEISEWKEVRYLDYLYENLTQYFNIPENIYVDTPINSVDEVFDHYLGGVYSPYNFYYRFLNNVVNYDFFMSSFFETVSNFTPTEKLLKIVGDIEPDLSLHIRRQDKIRKKDLSMGENGFEYIEPNELDFLKNKTFEIFAKLYKSNHVTYIASDEEEEKNSYKNKFNTITSEDFVINEEYVKTYVDLYMLSKSKTIILSQKHSNFSILASLLNKSNLIYIYNNDCNIHEFNFNQLDNIQHYEYFFKKNNII